MIDYNQKLIPAPSKIFANRSAKYLAPSLRLYGEEFTIKIRGLATLGVGIQDFGFNITKESRVYDNNLYLLVDTKGPKEYDKYVHEIDSKINFSYALQWLREQDCYINDYPFDSGRSGHQHMLVLKIPVENAMTNFLKGNYTSIYTRDVVEKIFTDKEGNKNLAYNIVTKNPDFLPEYVKALNSLFGSTVSMDSVSKHEQYDVPPFVKNEIFRFHE